VPAGLDRVGAELLLRAAMTAAVVVRWLGFLGCLYYSRKRPHSTIIICHAWGAYTQEDSRAHRWTYLEPESGGVGGRNAGYGRFRLFLWLVLGEYVGTSVFK
ncbi:unnamed protein product, partial [Ectocarpus sp. 12 AP-2014]